MARYLCVVVGALLIASLIDLAESYAYYRNDVNECHVLPKGAKSYHYERCESCTCTGKDAEASCVGCGVAHIVLSPEQVSGGCKVASVERTPDLKYPLCCRAMDTLCLKVVHVQQRANWDCGLACVKMILRSLDKDLSLIPEYMKEIRLERSVYTIDLAYILSRFGFQSTLYTLSFEVDEDYASMAFYKSTFQPDKERVDGLFKSIHHHGVSCIKQHLSIAELSTLMESSNTVLIALVDWNMMSCTECGTKAMQVCSSFCSKLCFSSRGYQGHFILVTSIDLAEDEVVFHNPSRSSGPCYCSIQTFDKGRVARGTDEDLLLVTLPS